MSPSSKHLKRLSSLGAVYQPHEMPTSVPSIGKLMVKRWRSRRGLMFIAGPSGQASFGSAEHGQHRLCYRI